MAVLTIEIPDKEIKFVTEFLKKIGGKVKKQNNLSQIPNAETINAMDEVNEGKVKKFKTAKSAIAHLQKLTDV